jgi:NAD(P)-dependent dehydrogenase (short-subunit alcohol dehydrogenase family)
MGFLQDKVAIVLGVSSERGMGEATARKLIAEGAKVIVAARREKELNEKATGLGAIAQVCDITDPEQVAALAARAIDEYGKLDCAINCAGVSGTGNIADTDPAVMKQMSDVHFCGTFNFFRYMAAAMENGGAMVTLSTVTAYRYVAGAAAYMATKAAADNLMRTAAMEFGSKNIRVNTVVPGFTDDTPMAREYQKIKGLNELFLKEIPLGRLNTAEDVAHVAAWLCHDDSYITGQVIHANGGNHLTRLPTMAEMSALFEKG